MYLRNSGNTSAMLAPCEEDYDYSTVNYNPNPGEARGRSSCLYASNSFHTIRSQSQCAPLEGNNYKEASGSTPHVAENFECRDAIYSAREETSRKNLKAHVARNLGEGTDSAGISQYNVHHTIQKIPSILEHDGAWDPNVVDAVDNETPTRFQLPDFSQTNAEYTGEGEIQTKERKPQEELPAKPLKRGKASTASRYNGASLKGKLNARSLKKAYRNGISCPSESKDRHSKVVTSKGPRDRRMRLSIETALKFFALQDKLGYDQPSQAVEWLIQKSNYAISELPHILRMPPTEHSNTGSLSPVQSPQPSPTRGNPYTANAEYRPNFDEKIVEGSFVADLSTEPPVVLPYSAGNITPHESNENPKIFTGLPIEDDLWLEREGSNSRQLNTTAQRSSPRKGSRVMQSGVEARERAPHLGELSYKRAKRRTATCYSQQKTAPNSTEHISDEEDGNRLFGMHSNDFPSNFGGVQNPRLTQSLHLASVDFFIVNQHEDSNARSPTSYPNLNCSIFPQSSPIP